jgi:uncharacterized protein (DUF1697 family)
VTVDGSSGPRYRHGMTKWVALLRGVNVNGITIRSAELAELVRGLGHADVRTVLASGNVVFTADDTADAGAVRATVEQALRDRFGYDAWIVLVPHAAVAGIIAGFPFPSAEDRHDYVVFGSEDEALDDLLDGIAADGIEQVARGDGVVYWSCPKGSSTSTPFAKRAGAARFKRTTTTRNTNTLRKLL